MKSTWTVNENSSGDLIVEVNQEAWEKAQKKALEALAKNLEVQGFRKGHVPANIAKQHINQQQVLLDAVNEVANDAFVAGMLEHEIEPVAQPQLDINAMTETELTLKFIVTVKPEVKLGEYKGIKVEDEDISVSEEEVNETLEAMREQNAELVLKEDGEVVDGDTVIMDFEGFKDEVAFEGGKGENYELVIGSNSFIPGFEEAMIGMKAGEEKDLDITFPESYHVEELKGQPVVFKVKLHEIKEKQLPELNDDFVELLDEEFDSFEDLKNSVKEDLEAAKKQAEEDRVNELLIKTAADNAEMEIPEAMVEEELEQMFREFEQRLQQQGMNFELYSQILGQSKEDIQNEMKEDANLRIRTRLTLEKIAEVEEMKVEESEIEEEYSNISAMYGMEVEQIKQIASEEAISYDILLRKAIELIQETRA